MHVLQEWGSSLRVPSFCRAPEFTLGLGVFEIVALVDDHYVPLARPQFLCMAFENVAVDNNYRRVGGKSFPVAMSMNGRPIVHFRISWHQFSFRDAGQITSTRYVFVAFITPMTWIVLCVTA